MISTGAPTMNSLIGPHDTENLITLLTTGNKILQAYSFRHPEDDIVPINITVTLQVATEKPSTFTIGIDEDLLYAAMAETFARIQNALREGYKIELPSLQHRSD